VDARSVVDQYTTVAPQVTQALGFLSGLSKSIPDVGGLQNQFTELPTSLLECSKKYLQQQQQEA
jgi:hypothetical protein